ncbi:hypothetical protein L3Q82_008025 [Scortum barcoo]|uniref:Uncharacterized protein n=1 Tax=Scortum barcoo TaxID=214431 RepID=A0ACB8WKX7_9TELE|nr:hypothetical protein L3Q82_008025 [Scortum barcoo]
MLQREEKDSITLSEVRLILIGGRWAGKSSSGNTILRKEKFECARTRTAQAEVAQEVLEGRKVIVVDAPGWSNSPSLTEIPEGDKQRFKLNMSKCSPGPHVFLLVVPIDTAFSVEHRRTVEEHMKLLGERAWKYIMVLFTCGDFLGEKTIEQHIESEGEALKWLVEKCRNTYHVFNNKDKTNSSQVTELLEKINEMMWCNKGSYYKIDEQTLHIIREKQREVAERAEKRRRRAEELRQQMKTLIPEEMETIPKLQMILLGSRGVGKTSVGNSILGFKDHGDGKRTTQSVAQQGFVGSSTELQELRIVMFGQKTSGKSATGNNLLQKKMFATCENKHCQMEEGEVAGKSITVIDTPGWYEDSSRCTEEMDKEIVRGLSMSPVGVHAVLLVVPLDLMFREPQKLAVEEHMNLFDASIWKYTMVLFTYGDKLEDKSVEEHIESEHSALRWLVDKCENKYHVVNNLKKTDMSQVTELFEKIEEMVAANSNRLFCPDMNNIHLRIDEKFSRRQLKYVLKQRLEEEYRKRELELLKGFKEKLLELQADIQRNMTGSKPKSLSEYHTVIGIGQRKKDEKEKEEYIDAKIRQEIEKLDKDIMTSSDRLQSSMDIFPFFKGDSPPIAEALSVRSQSTSHSDKILRWLSTLQIGSNVDNQLTLDFSQTSGYRSVLYLPHDTFDSDTEADIAE